MTDKPEEKAETGNITWIQARADRGATTSPSMTDLHDADVLVWAERQADLLRRRAAGDLVNDAEFDWPNLAEEIQDVGSNRFHAVEAFLVQALRHMLKAAAWPLAPYVPHWEAEARAFRGDAAAQYLPSMRRRLDMERIYRRALRGLPEIMDGQPPLPVPAVCPVTLDELLAEDW